MATAAAANRAGTRDANERLRAPRAAFEAEAGEKGQGELKLASLVTPRGSFILRVTSNRPGAAALPSEPHSGDHLVRISAEFHRPILRRSETAVSKTNNAGHGFRNSRTLPNLTNGFFYGGVTLYSSNVRDAC